ncbi:hypothetical protein AB4851_11670 [Burkholderia sp. 22PA0099]|uniref:hypothetical protein n=1 Tax=Burkholderia sp. 22PA0099 TaxID=3237372 RepID=UPI0039C35224
MSRRLAAGPAGPADRRGRAAAVFAALAATLALSLAARPARADGVDLAASRFQSMLSCAPGAHWPSPAERTAWRGVGMAFVGYAHDGSVVVDAGRDAPADRWEEMRVRFPRPVAIEGLPVTQLHLSRQQSGDTEVDYDLTVYAETTGELAAFAAARRLVPMPSAVPAGLDIGNNMEDGHAAGFHASYLHWAAPLSKLQAEALAEPGSTYLPGAHRLPSVRFAGALAGTTGRFAFGCVVFGPDVTPIDGM